MAHAILHPPPWIVYPAIVAFVEGVIGHQYGCLMRAPPGFECDAQWGLVMPIGLVSPFREMVAWYLPAGILFLLVKSLREAFEESIKAAVDRFFGRIVHADPYALFGTIDQRGLRPPGWVPLPEGLELAGPDDAEFHEQAERGFVLVNRAWARQDPMAAREVVATPSWVELSALIDESRRYRRTGIPSVGLEIAAGRVLRSGFLDGQEAVTARFDVRCTDPATSSRQDWTFVRPRDSGWLVAAVEPVKEPGGDNSPSGGG